MDRITWICGFKKWLSVKCLSGYTNLLISEAISETNQYICRILSIRIFIKVWYIIYNVVLCF